MIEVSAVIDSSNSNENSTNGNRSISTSSMIMMVVIVMAIFGSRNVSFESFILHQWY